MKKIILAIILLSSVLNAGKLYNYCLDKNTIADAKFKLYNIDICIDVDRKIDDLRMKGMLIHLISQRTLEELMTFGGRALLLEEILDTTKTEKAYITKFTVSYLENNK